MPLQTKHYIQLEDLLHKKKLEDWKSLRRP